MIQVVIERMRRIKQLPTKVALYLLAENFEIESIRELDQILTDNRWTPPHIEGGIEV